MNGKQILHGLISLIIIVLMVFGIGSFKHTEDLTETESQALVTELTKLEVTEDGE
ncbi:MAG TPA: hypothetical protein VF095_11455 [Bacillota bacterium]